MGLYFRKSVNFGGMRLNFSKSGIGLSTGVKGFRYSVGPKGAYINIGRNGVYYRKKLGANRPPAAPCENAEENRDQIPQDEPDRFTTCDASELVDSSSREILDQINENMRHPARGPIIRWVAVIAACFVAQLPFAWHWVSGLVVLIPGLFHASRMDEEDRALRTTPLFYELQDKAHADFQKIHDAFLTLAGAVRICRVQGEHGVSDWKRNAGANSLLSTSPIEVKCDDHPPFIATNLTVPSIETDTEQLFFFPDRILILQGNTYGAVSYDSLSLDFTTRSFIESRSVPNDAEVIGTTWEKVNKDGSRDKRFNENRELPVLRYGYLRFHSESGLNASLQVSSVKAAEQFSKAFHPFYDRHTGSSESTGSDSNKAQKKRRSRQSSEDTRNAPTNKAEAAPESPYRILGVGDNATWEEINTAYRRLVMMYHPDRVAGLGPEFIEIAERKMKEINGAHEALKNLVS
jgi:hypothetical protein